MGAIMEKAASSNDDCVELSVEFTGTSDEYNKVLSQLIINTCAHNGIHAENCTERLIQLLKRNGVVVGDTTYSEQLRALVRDRGEEGRKLKEITENRGSKVSFVINKMGTAVFNSLVASGGKRYDQEAVVVLFYKDNYFTLGDHAKIHTFLQDAVESITALKVAENTEGDTRLLQDPHQVPTISPRLRDAGYILEASRDAISATKWRSLFNSCLSVTSVVPAIVKRLPGLAASWMLCQVAKWRKLMTRLHRLLWWCELKKFLWHFACVYRFIE